MNTNKNFIIRITVAALFAALTLCATMMISIPLPNGGYVNLGDAVVLCAGALLPPPLAFLAAGLGSGLADVLAGYTVYAPVTFAIKGLMALLVSLVLRKKAASLPTLLISFFCAECIMVGGYLAFESILYGFAPSLLNVLPNALQGLCGLVIAILLTKVLKKSKFFR